MDIPRAANRYASSMLHVFPCHSAADGACSCGRPECDRQGKHPRTRNGLKDASNDLDQIREWWAQWPDASIGIATGPGSGCWVLDVDGAEGLDSLAVLEHEHGALPRTWTAITGGGGRHYYWAYQEPLRNSQSLIGCSLDARGDGGYVIAPPASHVSGGFYRWVDGLDPDAIKLESAPRWLTELATRKPEKPAHHKKQSHDMILGRASAYLASMQAATAGQGGHPDTFAAAVAMTQGFSLSEERAYDLLASEYNPRCTPPWSERELRHKVSDAAKSTQVPDGYLLDGQVDNQSAHRDQSQPTPPKPPINAESEPTSDGKIAIMSSGLQVSEVVAKAWKAVHETNEETWLYRTVDGATVQICDGGTGRATSVRLTVEDLRAQLYGRMNWFRLGQKGAWTPTNISREVSGMMFAIPSQKLPVLRGISHSPFFSRDGELVTRRGYHAGSGIYCDSDLELGSIVDSPGADDLRAAFELLTQDLLGDFPFETPTDAAHALCAILLPFMRRMIDGPTPLHMIWSSTPGTGKSLLADVVSMVATGRVGAPAAMPRGKSADEEIRKKITSALMRSSQMILWDNMDWCKSDAMAAALTAREWSDRLLGQSKEVQLPNDAMWIATGNNPTLSVDISRRVCSIKIDAQIERPETRTGFRHESLIEWAREHRASLVRAALVIGRFWLVHGRPPCEKSRVIGSFESWSKVIGGAVRLVTGEGVFMKNFETLRDTSDDESSMMRAIFVTWRETWGSEFVSARQLEKHAGLQDQWIDLLGDQRSMRRSIGIKLAKTAGRVFDGLKLERRYDTHSKVGKYRLKSTEAPALELVK